MQGSHEDHGMTHHNQDTTSPGHPAHGPDHYFFECHPSFPPRHPHPV